MAIMVAMFRQQMRNAWRLFEGPSDIRKLEKLFGVQARTKGSNFRFELAAAEEHRKLALEIYP